MSRSKENIYSLKESDYVRYLYQEGQRQGIHKNPLFYPELIKFVHSPEGQESFEKFICLNPKKVGVTVCHATNPFKRAFQHEH